MTSSELLLLLHFPPSQAHHKEILEPYFALSAKRRDLIRAQVDLPEGSRSDWLLLKALEAEAEAAPASAVAAGSAPAAAPSALLLHNALFSGRGGGTAAAGGGGFSSIISPELLRRLIASSSAVDPRARATVGADLVDCTLLHVCAAAGAAEHVKARGGREQQTDFSASSVWRSQKTCCTL